MATTWLGLCWQLCIQLSWLSLSRVRFWVALRRRLHRWFSLGTSFELSWLWTGADSRWPSLLWGWRCLSSLDFLSWVNLLSLKRGLIVGFDRRMRWWWPRWCLLKWMSNCVFLLLERWCVWCSIDAMVPGVDVAKGLLWEDPIFEFAWEGVDVISCCSAEWLKRLLLWSLILSNQICGTNDSENHSEVHYVLLWKMAKLKETWLILWQHWLTISKVRLLHVVHPW